MQRVVTGLSVIILAGIMVLGASQVRAGEEKKKDDGENAASLKAGIQKMYMGFLGAEGFKPEIDSDGDIRFKFEGHMYFIHVDEKDANYVSIVLANIWPIENEPERQKAFMAANFSNAKSKTSKVYVTENNVWVSAEMLLPRREDFKPIFQRILAIIQNGADNYVRKMKEK